MPQYSREDGCRAWLTHARTQPDQLTRLMDDFQTAEAVYDQTCRDGGKTLWEYLAPYNVRRLLEAAKPENMHRMMVSIRDHHMRILSYRDTDYPPALAVIASQPPFLFAVGNPECMHQRCLTVIGSRRASPKAIADCQTICRQLSEHGVTVVSGLAVGLDTAAHEGSLQGPTPGIGVMACGLDVDYPTASRELKKALLEHGGLIIGECPPGVQPIRGAFNMRNRILSGLSKGVVVMECQIKSGTMTTVGYALDQGREVFARPGDSGSVYSEGTKSLLRDGARFFQVTEDLLEDLGWDDQVVQPDREPEIRIPMTQAMQTILRSLHTGVKGFDELIGETGLDAGTLSINLTMMQINGVINALPGKTYSIV